MAFFTFNTVSAIHFPHEGRARLQIETPVTPFYKDWGVLHKHGRTRVQNARREARLDAQAWRDFEEDICEPGPVKYQLSKAITQRAINPLPAYCKQVGPPSTPTACGPRFSFVKSFPPELRNRIYQYTVEYPSTYELREAFLRRFVEGQQHHETTPMHTPTILLLCKQITREALSLYRLEFFVIDRLPPIFSGREGPIPYTSMIGKQTLQSLRFVEIKLTFGNNEKLPSGKVWLDSLECVLRTWSEKNSLLRLKIMIKVQNVKLFFHRSDMRDDYQNVIKAFDDFAMKHGKSWPLIEYEHWVIDEDYAFKYTYDGSFYHLTVRHYPDPHIWQGNVLDWV